MKKLEKRVKEPSEESCLKGGYNNCRVYHSLLIKHQKRAKHISIKQRQIGNTCYFFYENMCRGFRK